MNEYGKYSGKIADICHRYGYLNCNECPLFSACNTTRKDGETQAEYTERSEKALAEAYKRLTEKKNINELWEAACSGDVEALKAYYTNGGEINRRYYRFGKYHSLIAGAYRNGNFATVKYLYEVGEIPEEHEKQEIQFSNYAVIVIGENGKIDRMRFNEYINAFSVFTLLNEIGNNGKEDIQYIAFEQEGKIDRYIEFKN